MSTTPSVDAALDASLRAIRAVLAEHDGLAAGSRARVAAMVRDVIAVHGPEAAGTMAIFLATAAATGFDNLAHRTGEPVEDLLGRFEHDLRTDTAFDVIIAGEFGQQR